MAYIVDYTECTKLFNLHRGYCGCIFASYRERKGLNFMASKESEILLRLNSNKANIFEAYTCCDQLWEGVTSILYKASERSYKRNV
eukprot:Nk52_evm89s221 gene=Nk52_evmTU89s221